MFVSNNNQNVKHHSCHPYECCENILSKNQIPYLKSPKPYKYYRHNHQLAISQKTYILVYHRGNNLNNLTYYDVEKSCNNTFS